MNIKVILFLLSFAVLGVTGLFIFNPSILLISIFVFIYLLSILSINLGWHRYFSHKSFHCGINTQNLFIFFGSSLFFGKISDWVKEHRDHHLFLNTNKDPQKSLDNFWKRAYWMCYKSSVDSSIIDKESDNVYFNWVNKHSIFSSILNNAVIVLFTSLFVKDDLLTVIWLLVFARVTLIFNIYTITHAFGHNSKFDYLHFLNLGEGNHEQHHKNPGQISLDDKNLTTFAFKIGCFLKVFYEK